MPQRDDREPGESIETAIGSPMRNSFRASGYIETGGDHSGRWVRRGTMSVNILMPATCYGGAPGRMTVEATRRVHVSQSRGETPMASCANCAALDWRLDVVPHGSRKLGGLSEMGRHVKGLVRASSIPSGLRTHASANLPAEARYACAPIKSGRKRRQLCISRMEMHGYPRWRQ